MSGTDGSERATEESKSQLAYEIERLQTIPEFQALVDEWDTDDETEAPPKAGHFVSTPSKQDWAVWLDMG